MGLMAFGANETPIQHIGLVELLLIFLCEEAFSLSCLSVSFFLCLSLSLPLSLYRSVSLCLSLSVSLFPSLILALPFPSLLSLFSALGLKLLYCKEFQATSESMLVFQFTDPVKF